MKAAGGFPSSGGSRTSSKTTQRGRLGEQKNKITTCGDIGDSNVPSFPTFLLSGTFPEIPQMWNLCLEAQRLEKRGQKAPPEQGHQPRESLEERWGRGLDSGHPMSPNPLRAP